jgi:site-specific recombinase XerD
MGDLVHVPKTVEALALREAELTQGVREHVGNAKAASSRHSYEADWRVFEGWCASMRYATVPPKDEIVAMFLRSQFNDGRKMKTIARYVSGLAYGFRSRGFDWDVPKLVTEMLKGARRERAGQERVTKKADVSDTLLARIVAGTGPTALRDRALLLLGWTGAFRRSELVALDVEHLTFTPEGVKAYIGKSKTDQSGRGAEVAIPIARDADLCAIRAIREWMTSASITQGALFRAMTRTGRVLEHRLSAQSVALIVKRAIAREKLDPALFAGHSLRAGFATTAARKDVPLQKIMNQTRHTDVRTVREYIRSANIFEDSGAKGLL